MPNLSKADLILHPARLSILEALAHQPHTTRELDALLPNIALPSLYRHLKVLTTGGLVEVAETRPVRGVSEKVYRLTQPPRLDPEETAGHGKEPFLRQFIAYSAVLIQHFADYLASAPEPLNPLADQTGFSEITFEASESEMEEFRQALQTSMISLSQNPPGAGRRRRKISIISHPLPKKDPPNEH